MARIAVDVVLLPDEAITDRAIETNKWLIGNRRGEIVLNKTTCLPHVSLAMGCLEEEDVDAVRDLLQRLARETAVRNLKIMGVLTPTNSRGEKTSLFEVEKTDDLQRLHERVMGEMEPFFSYDVTDAMFYDDVVAETTLEWVRHYPHKASYERFSPHITVGYGEAEPPFSLPIAFRAVQVALCHLGNHCTCRKVLAAANLS